MERLSLPAAAESEATWTQGFHFAPMPEEQLQAARTELRILLFPDARILHKAIACKEPPPCPPSASERGDDAGEVSMKKQRNAKEPPPAASTLVEGASSPEGALRIPVAMTGAGGTWDPHCVDRKGLLSCADAECGPDFMEVEAEAANEVRRDREAHAAALRKVLPTSNGEDLRDRPPLDVGGEGRLAWKTDVDADASTGEVCALGRAGVPRGPPTPQVGEEPPSETAPATTGARKAMPLSVQSLVSETLGDDPQQRVALQDATDFGGRAATNVSEATGGGSEFVLAACLETGRSACRRAPTEIKLFPSTPDVHLSLELAERPGSFSQAPGGIVNGSIQVVEAPATEGASFCHT